MYTVDGYFFINVLVVKFSDGNYIASGVLRYSVIITHGSRLTVASFFPALENKS